MTKRRRQGDNDNISEELRPLAFDVDHFDPDPDPIRDPELKRSEVFSDYKSIFYDGDSVPDFRRPWLPSGTVQRTRSRLPARLPSRSIRSIRFGTIVHPVRALKRELICRSRHVRRAVLFAIGISGHKKKRSPGRGGSYRRTENSNVRC